MSALARAVSRAGRWLEAIYELELEVAPERFLVAARTAREWLPESGPFPRSGVVAVERDESLELGLYVDPRDGRDPGVVLEETSHLVCLCWHAARDLPVTALALELQGEIDRFLYGMASGGDALRHFRHFHFADWLDPGHHQRYVAAHWRAERYCRSLATAFPRRRDFPALVRELRRFYRASPQAKLQLTVA